MINAQQIREHMEVIGADDVHVGVVDRVEAPTGIKLTRSDPGKARTTTCRSTGLSVSIRTSTSTRTAANCSHCGNIRKPACVHGTAAFVMAGSTLLQGWQSGCWSGRNAGGPTPVVSEPHTQLVG